jgi:outer membrane protein assembly factor BamB
MYIYSLIDGSILWRSGAAQKDEFAHRESWQAYDSSPLVSAEADTLIWPGENGVLYTFVLNAEFDRSAGTVQVTPSEPVKYRYTTPESADDADNVRWYGMENSAAIWKNYIYFTDNGGWLQCVDLNTMQPVFVQDVKGDSDCSPLLEPVGGELFLYTASEIDNKRGADNDGSTGTSYIRKINAMTGEILWEASYACYNRDGATGGVLASPVLGRGTLEGLVVFSVSRVEDMDKGILVAFDKTTGEKVWEQKMAHYSWSSPVAVYTPDGTGYIVHCDSRGDMSLRDGLTGEVLDKVNLGENVEASPAVFNNMIVVGTKGEKIYGVRIN